MLRLSNHLCTRKPHTMCTRHIVSHTQLWIYTFVLKHGTITVSQIAVTEKVVTCQCILYTVHSPSLSWLLWEALRTAIISSEVATLRILLLSCSILSLNSSSGWRVSITVSLTGPSSLFFPHNLPLKHNPPTS